MQKLDAIVAATGAVVLVVAIAGAALYGGSSTTEAFQITFASSDTDLDPESGPATGTGLVADFTVSPMNVTTVKVTVTVTGAAARLAAVPIVVEVTGPNNLTGSEEGSLGQGPVASVTIEVTIPTGVVVPSDHGYEAASLAAAEAHARTFATENGTGAWSVTVRASPQIPPNEAITASVALSFTSYDVLVSRPPPAAAP